jgi:threonine dehydrogenase-like Zn-dependent dehydrogenase
MEFGLPSHSDLTQAHGSELSNELTWQLVREGGRCQSEEDAARAFDAQAPPVQDDRSPAPPIGGIMTSGATPVSPQRDPELLGQTVVVIGGSAGIGLETARRARAEGAEVILTGRNPERLNQAAREVDAQRAAAFDANDATSL